ncbi:ABC transporter ATP-binding protein [Streptomyces sp. NPDC059697]|uniref:ABC transporter ATP-binding protein n=1 Tax=Streptomyces sp. NPDC059697 TaxID=3346912 RepID=UPI00367DEE7F
MSTRTRQWMFLLRLNWRTSPLRCWLIVATLVLDVFGQPAFALALRNFADAVVADQHTAALRDAVLAAALFSLSTQMPGVRNLLRRDVCERAGLILDGEVLGMVSGIPTVHHLEDPRSLDRIDAVAGRGAELSNAVFSAAETLATVMGIGTTLLVLATVSPILLPTVLLCLPTLWLNRIGQARIRSARLRAAEAQRTADDLLQVFFDPTVATELRVTGAGPMILNAYQRRWRTASRTVGSGMWRAGALLAVGWLVFLAGFTVALGFTAVRLSHGSASVGDLIMLLTVARQQQGMLQNIVAQVAQFMAGIHIADAYWWLRGVAAESAPSATLPVPATLSHGIELDRVSFSYPGTKVPVLRDISAKLPAGSLVALVGSHGSGKTSLIKLLTGMYAPTSGRLTVEHGSLQELDPAAWRARLTCGFQDFVHYPTLAHEAVGVGDLPAVDDLPEVRRAVAQGGATRVVERLDDGLMTQLDPVFGGVELSGGQWQKLALARTCMRRSPLLVVLDEPTAALDARSEYEVFQRQVQLARELARRSGTITIIVSHRYSTVRMADKILVLSHGSVIEDGDHQRLMALGGEYARLYAMQEEAYA